MAQDLILNENSLLTDIKAPYINDIAARRVLSNQILSNVYTGLIEKDGEGITQEFSRDTSGAEIRVILPKPLKSIPRTLGGLVNGGNFPTQTREVSVSSVGVPVLFTLDEPIDIAEVTRDMLPVDLLGVYLKNWTDESILQTNAMTIAGKFVATYKGKATNIEVNEVVSDETDVVEDFIEANSLLDEGAEDVGIMTFPSDDRVAVIRSVYRAPLLKKGVLTLNGSDRAAEALENGTLSAGARPRKLEDGYIGTIDNLPFHIANNIVWKTAAKWAGIGEGDFANVIGYVSSGKGNIRGIASPYDVQVDSHPTGRGVRLKPLWRAGFKVADGFEKGNVFVVNNEFKNPYDALTKNGFDVNKVALNAYGSRQYTGLNVTTAGGKITATAPGAFKIIGAKGDAKGSVALFNTFAGPVNLTSGVQGTVGTTGDVVSVLTIGQDGTCEIATVKVA